VGKSVSIRSCTLLSTIAGTFSHLNGGTPTHPYWYYNVLAHPNVTFETGKETLEAQLVVLPREERGRIYQQLIVIYPPLIEYQINAGARVIPIIEVIRTK
jgi:deazaflavin-dependent oxidoreductase (nitroreductase family)